MSWLEKLDQAASRHWLTKAPYWALRWYLIALGGFAVIRLFLDRVGIWPLY